MLTNCPWYISLDPYIYIYNSFTRFNLLTPHGIFLGTRPVRGIYVVTYYINGCEVVVEFNGFVLSNTWHFVGLLINNSGGWRTVLEDNFITIIEIVHSLSHELPKKPSSTGSPTDSITVYCIIHFAQVTIPFSHTVWPTWLPKFTNDNRLPKNIFRILNVLL